MRLRFIPLYLFGLIALGSCNSHPKTKHMSTNPLLCDTADGVCAIPGSTTHVASDHSLSDKHQTTLHIMYFTDPICSSCWGIEPQLRKLKLEYGAQLDIDYHMGGLLPDWSYNSGGISKPSDVAHHWDEVSAYYKMPIDGDVWLEDPLPSSYPPSIAFKAAQLQNEHKALLFLRAMREMVFLEKKNIAKWEHIAGAALRAGLDTALLKQDTDREGKTLFLKDLELARQMGVRGFPTLLFTNGQTTPEVVYGFKPYTTFENTVHKLLPSTQKFNYGKTWQELFTFYKSFTLREFSELSGLSFESSETLLNDLTVQHKLIKQNTKNGALWSKP